MKTDRMVWGKRTVFLLSGIIGLGLLLPTHSEAKKPRDLGQACPEPRVKRASPDTLLASPLFTGVSSLPIRQPSIYAGFRPACPQTPY